MSEFSWTDEGTLYSEDYKDVYFSDGEGLEETKHVFLEGNNISERMSQGNLVIGELGFGTGLNFLVTWQQWRKVNNGNRLIFISCEKHPLQKDLLEEVHNKFPEFTETSAQLREKWPLTENGFHALEFEQGKVLLLLLFGDVIDVFKQLETKVDAWYLDGFSPSINPQMWNEEVFQQIAWHSHKETTLATYSAAGFVRRGLSAVGFDVKRAKGFGRKIHMTVGRYNGYVKEKMTMQPWFQLPTVSKPKRVAVIGSGMAGLNCAWSLARLGVEVCVFDKHSRPAAEASGNKRGMMFPMISKKPDRLGLLTETSAAFSLNQFKELGISFEQGLLEFITEDKKKIRFDEAIKRYRNEYLELLSPEEINARFSIETSFSAIWHSQAVSISPVEYAEALIRDGGFEMKLSTDVKSLEKSNERWFVSGDWGSEEFDCVVIASACESRQFVPEIPLRKTRGQLIYLDKKHFKSFPQRGINYVNYLAPVNEQEAVLGATFQVDDSDAEMRGEDAVSLIESLNKHFPDTLNDLDPHSLSGRVSFRAMLKDYFPVIGPVPDWQKYEDVYADLKHGKSVSSYEEASYQTGLYMSCGHGSRGLTLSPLAGAQLARQIVDGVSLLSVEHAQAVHPGRFLVSQLKKKKSGLG